MPANIDTMFYYDNPPWHGIGHELKSPATSAQAIKAAQLDWEVRCLPTEAVLPDGESIPIKNGHAVVRMDRKVALGTVGRLYTPIQNVEAFSFFDSVVGKKRAIYEVAGSLGMGEQVWILAKLPNDIRIKRTDDLIQRYLLLVNAHDGEMSLLMFFTPIRVVCQNTLTAALAGRKGAGISIRHFPNIHKRVEEAQRALGLALKTYDGLKQTFNRLAEVQVGEEWLEDYVGKVMDVRGGKEPSKRLVNMRAGVIQLFESKSNTLKGIEGTAWAAYNAITEWVDHFRVVPKLEQDETKRLASIWLGSGAQLKRKALKIAVELAA